MIKKGAQLMVYLLGVFYIAKSVGNVKQRSSVDNYYGHFVGEKHHRLPFVTRLAASLQEGHTIQILGTLNAEPKRVNFNFRNGDSITSNMPLHFSLRFDEGVFSGSIVYNTFINGIWNNEERIANPFYANQVFDIRFRIIESIVEVFANRKKIGEFVQRASVSKVDHALIDGDLVDLRLFHYGGQLFSIPFSGIARLSPNKRLDLSALPTGQRITISLYNANIIPIFQLSIRFDEKVIVRNSMENNQWGPEERFGGFPIKDNEIFDLTIVNEEFSFQIFFNQQRFTTFAHRAPPYDIETLEIDGDLEIHFLTIKNNLHD